MKRHKKHSKKRGFSLIELLIVVVIILIIAAIAIPNLLRSRIAANESSALRNLDRRERNSKGHVQLTIAIVRNRPVLGSALFAQQQDVATAHTHRRDPLVRIDRLEPQHLAVELYGTRRVRDVQGGLDQALNTGYFHRKVRVAGTFAACCEH